MAGCGGPEPDTEPRTREEDVMIDIHWHGHDTFGVADAGRQIYFDPYKLPDGLPPADVIFITHGHGDHFSPADVARVRTDATVFVAPVDVAADIGKQATAMKPGDQTEVAGLVVKAVPAYNVNKFRSPGVPFHPKENNWVGYVVTLTDGTTLYHAGDTDFIPEMKDLEADVALLPVSGTYVMTAEEAVEAANAMMPKVAIPMHYGGIVGTDADAETLKEGFKGETRILEPER
jgi:L-ascorbate metabolism protein UlaG (beta-lactamase superfamily)